MFLVLFGKISLKYVNKLFAIITIGIGIHHLKKKQSTLRFWRKLNIDKIFMDSKERKLS